MAEGRNLPPARAKEQTDERRRTCGSRAARRAASRALATANAANATAAAAAAGAAGALPPPSSSSAAKWTPGLSEPALLSGRVPFGPTTNGGNTITIHVRTLSRSFKF